MSRAARYAANTVVDGPQRFEPGVVEVADGRVVAVYALDGELPHTAWLGGTIEVKAGPQGCRVAYHNEKPIN